jgi:hypothetical protein
MEQSGSVYTQQNGGVGQGAFLCLGWELPWLPGLHVASYKPYCVSPFYALLKLSYYMSTVFHTRKAKLVFDLRRSRVRITWSDKALLLYEPDSAMSHETNLKEEETFLCAMLFLIGG